MPVMDPKSCLALGNKSPTKSPAKLCFCYIFVAVILPLKAASHEERQPVSPTLLYFKHGLIIVFTQGAFSPRSLMELSDNGNGPVYNLKTLSIFSLSLLLIFNSCLFHSFVFLNIQCSACLCHFFVVAKIEI